MKTLLLLLTIGGTLCLSVHNSYYPYDYNNKQNGNSHSSALNQLLAKAPPQAINAYLQIVQNFSQSLAYLRTAFENWAKTYGLEQEYRRFLAASQKENEEFKRAISELYPMLTRFLTDYMKYGNDRRQSIMLAFNRTASLTNRADNRQNEVVESIIDLYLSSLAGAGTNTRGNGYAGNSGSYWAGNGMYNGNNVIYNGPNGGGPSNGWGSGVNGMGYVDVRMPAGNFGYNNGNSYTTNQRQSGGWIPSTLEWLHRQ
ncbi:unnamed protein product [Cylicocyclus nassatus]|uniref:SXP/RAL-2 family protein Ani s 5-like cation-binding domain-containing protein n=1 Tax=Cylicocyclus nassatus TaxID=53992 RepID=A0AA36H2R6_CYLNA|nr:unnamed protein product [Cylicocyclus nassatus]